MKKVCFILCLTIFSFAFGTRLSTQNVVGPYIGDLYNGGSSGSVSESSSFADNDIKWKRRHKKRKKARRPQRGR